MLRNTQHHRDARHSSSWSVACLDSLSLLSTSFAKKSDGKTDALERKPYRVRAFARALPGVYFWSTGTSTTPVYGTRWSTSPPRSVSSRRHTDRKSLGAFFSPTFLIACRRLRFILIYVLDKSIHFKFVRTVLHGFLLAR
jgi:hypothetical protein